MARSSEAAGDVADELIEFSLVVEELAAATESSQSIVALGGPLDASG